MNNEASPSIYYIWEGCFYEGKSHFKIFTFSYAVTGAFLLFLLFLAFLLFQFDLGEKPVSAGIVAVYILSCFQEASMSGKFCAKISIYGEFW